MTDKQKPLDIDAIKARRALFDRVEYWMFDDPSFRYVFVGHADGDINWLIAEVERLTSELHFRNAQFDDSENENAILRARVAELKKEKRDAIMAEMGEWHRGSFGLGPWEAAGNAGTNYAVVHFWGKAAGTHIYELTRNPYATSTTKTLGTFDNVDAAKQAAEADWLKRNGVTNA